MFALRFGPVSPVVPVGAGPFAGGARPSESAAPAPPPVTTPYAPCTVNVFAVDTDAAWARLSCACGACLGVREGACSSPSPWYPCSVTRKPSKNFCNRWVSEQLAATKLAGKAAMDARIVALGKSLVHDVLHYKQEKAARTFVRGVFNRADWAAAWCKQAEQAPRAFESAERHTARLAAELQAVGWTPPAPQATSRSGVAGGAPSLVTFVATSLK